MSKFWKAAGTRAARTAAQAALAVLGGGAVNVIEVDWVGVASVSAGAALVSLLTSIATGLPEVNEP